MGAERQFDWLTAKTSSLYLPPIPQPVVSKPGRRVRGLCTSSQKPRLDLPPQAHARGRGGTRTLRKASREPFSIYSVTIIARRPGAGSGERVALGWGSELLIRDPRSILPSQDLCQHWKPQGALDFHWGPRLWAPRVIWGPKPRGQGQVGQSRMDEGWTQGPVQAGGALQGEAVLAWHLPRVTTPSRRIMLGWSNCPMMDASLRKSRRCLSV